MSRPAVGFKVGRYRLIQRLGAGAMGEVFLAEDPTIGRRVAIKTVLFGDEGLQGSGDRKARLVREAQAAGRLLHPNVVTLFDAGEHDGWVWLAFEFVDGSTLGQRAEREPPLTLGEILCLVREVAQGLALAHEQGIVHRDIKPSNLLVDSGGRAKIADFGIARVAGETTELTATGSVVGSPSYLAPEQVRGEELDGRNDLFSLGVVFYELLTGERPFPGETLTTLVYQILNQEPKAARHRCPGLPPAVERILARMLAKEPDDRWPSAKALVEALEAVESSLAPRLLALPPRSLPAVPRPPEATLEGATAPTRLVPRAEAMTPHPALPQAAKKGFSPLRSRWVLGVVVLVSLLALWAFGGKFGRGGRDPARHLVPPPVESMTLEKAEAGELPTAEAAPGTDSHGAQGEVETEDGRAGALSTPESEAQHVDSQDGGSTDADSAENGSLSGDLGEPPASPQAQESFEQGADREIRVEDGDVLTLGLELLLRPTPTRLLVEFEGGSGEAKSRWLSGPSRFRIPREGSFRVRFSSPGHASKRVRLLAQEGREEVTVLDVVLEPAAAPRPLIRDADSVLEVRRGLELEVVPPRAGIVLDGKFMGTAIKFLGQRQKRAMGRVDLEPGEHRLAVRAPGFIPLEIRILVHEQAAEERQRLVLRLERRFGGPRRP